MLNLCRHILFVSAFYFSSQAFWWHTAAFEEDDNETAGLHSVRSFGFLKFSVLLPAAGSKMFAAEAVTRSFIFIREMRQTGLLQSFGLK